jgi:hypothetical protein
MQRLLFIVVCFFAALFSFAQDTTRVQMGGTIVKIAYRQNPACPCRVLLLNVHENEQTSVAVADSSVQVFPAGFMRLVHTQQRNVVYHFGIDTFAIDPNRIFSAKGRHASLTLLSHDNVFAEKAAAGLADSILKKYVDRHPIIVAMHNNTPDTFTVHTYEGGKSRVYINPDEDQDDFVVTTSLPLFRYLRTKGINAVHETHRLAEDDGSLLIYASRKGKTYINIEAEHGHLAQQARIMAIVTGWLQKELRRKTRSGQKKLPYTKRGN